MAQILDIYRQGSIVYADLNSAYFIEKSDDEIREILNFGVEFEIHKTKEFNVAIYISFPLSHDITTITIQTTVYTIKLPLNLASVNSQICLLFKNEWNRVPKVLDFYKRTHGIQRFILYDNSEISEPPPEILARSDVIYNHWSLQYKYTLKDRAAFDPQYTGPDTIIVAQNAAYSHCLKRYNQATWTIFIDNDEFIVRRRDGKSLNSILEETNSEVNTLIIKGYWSGCNGFTQQSIYENLRKFGKRSKNFCMNKLILRTSAHKFTNCIHTAYPTAGKSIMLAFEKGIYFFHLYTASQKSRACKCSEFCAIPDKSLIESFRH